MRSHLANSPRLAALALVVLGLTLPFGAEASSIKTVTDLGAGVSGLVLGESGQVAGFRPDGKSVDPSTNLSATPFEYAGGRYTTLDSGVVPISVASDGRVIDARGPYTFYNDETPHHSGIDVGPLATAGNHLGELVGTGVQWAYEGGSFPREFLDVSFQIPYLYQPDKPGQFWNSQFAIQFRGGIISFSPSNPLGHGTMTPLVLLGSGAHPTAINDNGLIVGDLHSTDGQLINTYLGMTSLPKPPPETWHAAVGQYSLGTLGGTNSHATAVSNSGLVVGFSDTTAGASHAFLDAPNPHPLYPNIPSYAKMIDLGTLPGMTSSAALGVNDQGQVVGWSGNGSISHAFLYSNGIMEDLNSRLPATLGLTLDKAIAINDAGQIVAYGHGADGVEHGYLLGAPPVPEPTALALLVLAGVGLFGVRRLRNSKGSGAIPSA